MKGQKICSNCGRGTGPRAYMCKNCNTPFAFKPTSKEKKNTKIVRDFNWRDLKAGDKIKVSGGPYFVSHGDFIPMGYRGKFVVEGVDDTCGGAKFKSGEGLDVCQAIHAEQNALLQCKDVYDIETIYCTVSPCIHCVKLLLNTSVKNIIFGEKYIDCEVLGDYWWKNKKEKIVQG